MKILLVLCRNPFGSEGGANYAIKGALRLLAEHHQVIVCGFGRDFRQGKLGGFPCAGCLGIATNRPTQFMAATLLGKSYTQCKYGHRAAKKELSRILAQDSFDVLWFEQTQAAFAADQKRIAGDFPSLQIVLRSHNIESAVVGNGTQVSPFVRPLLRCEARKLRDSEHRVWRWCDSIAAISREDARLINAELGRSEAKAVFLPVTSPTSGTARVPQSFSEKDRNRIVFVGDCRWQPNREAALWIVNKLAASLQYNFPDIEIQLVGRETEKIAKDARPKNVIAMGYVDRIEPVYQDAICALAPISAGSGVNIKVIEALVEGLPVIGSPMARRGIECDGFLVASTPDQYCSLIRELRNCANTWRHLSSVARTFDRTSTGDAMRALNIIL
jgi:glycosyltransferase involved in cell wall biosynthesis